MEDALTLAYEVAHQHFVPEGINRVILLTDGAANLGDVRPERLSQQVEAERINGIALDCFGVGWEGFNDTLLERLSRNGDGRYGFLNDVRTAGATFADMLAGSGFQREGAGGMESKADSKVEADGLCHASAESGSIPRCERGCGGTGRC